MGQGARPARGRAHADRTVIVVETMFGRLRLTADRHALVALDWVETGIADKDGDESADAISHACLAQALDDLRAYERDPTHAFTVPLDPRGTAFQRRVWTTLRAIPAGTVRRYGEIATEAGGVPRAIGQACGANPIPIIIPCHRVVSAQGLGGFSAAGGASTKRRLLDHEGWGRGADLFGPSAALHGGG